MLSLGHGLVVTWAGWGGVNRCRGMEGDGWGGWEMSGGEWMERVALECIGMNGWGRLDGMNGWDRWMGRGGWMLGGDGLMGMEEQGGADGDGWMDGERQMGMDRGGWGGMRMNGTWMRMNR